MLAAAAAVPSPSICPGAVSKDLLSELIEQESTNTVRTRILASASPARLEQELAILRSQWPPTCTSTFDLKALGQGGRRSWDGKELVEFFSGAGSRARCPSPLGALVIVTGTDELWEGGQGMLAPLLSATDSTAPSVLHVSRSTRTSHAVFVVPVVLESADETADELQLRLANRWTAESPPFSGRALAGRLGMPRMVPANALDADCIPRGGWQQLHGMLSSWNSDDSVAAAILAGLLGTGMLYFARLQSVKSKPVGATAHPSGSAPTMAAVRADLRPPPSPPSAPAARVTRTAARRSFTQPASEPMPSQSRL